MKVIRTLEINDLTPAEVASIFAGWFAEEQAQFFSEVWQIAKAWPGAGWCKQSCALAEELDSDGRNAITTLAAHVLETTE